MSLLREKARFTSLSEYHNHFSHLSYFPLYFSVSFAVIIPVPAQTDVQCFWSVFSVPAWCWGRGTALHTRGRRLHSHRSSWWHKLRGKAKAQPAQPKNLHVTDRQTDSCAALLLFVSLLNAESPFPCRVGPREPPFPPAPSDLGRCALLQAGGTLIPTNHSRKRSLVLLSKPFLLCSP